MKIGIVGLGLIGGSIFKALSGKYSVIGVSSSVQEENVSSDYNTLKDCDLVFVCSPMSATLEVLDKLNNILDSNTIVTDVCSLKEFVSKRKYNFKFIPSHPMAGTEYSGWDNSFPELFRGANWAITPIDGEILPEQELLENIINDLGAKTIITTAEEHDKAVALISHFPLDQYLIRSSSILALTMKRADSLFVIASSIKSYIIALARRILLYSEYPLSN